MAAVAEPVPRRRAAPTWPAYAVLGVSVAFVAASFYAKFVVGGYWWGAPLAPLYLYPGVEASGLALPAAAALAACAGLAVALRGTAVRPAAFALGALALGTVARLSLALVRDGTSGWLSALGRGGDAQNEYLPALPALSIGRLAFLDRFAEVAPTLPTHPSAHPPGLLLTMDLLGITTPIEMAAFEIAAAALAIPVVYALARRLLPEAGARTATLLFAFCPAIMIYGVTSSDGLYVTLGALAALALIGRPAIACTLGAAALAVCSFFSYSLLAVGAWATVVVALRQGLVRAVVLGASCAAALVALYAGLWALTGFDLPAALALRRPGLPAGPVLRPALRVLAARLAGGVDRLDRAAAGLVRRPRGRRPSSGGARARAGRAGGRGGWLHEVRDRADMDVHGALGGDRGRPRAPRSTPAARPRPALRPVPRHRDPDRRALLTVRLPRPRLTARAHPVRLNRPPRVDRPGG
ncbi:MAG: hypothetical protein WKF31_03780 [Thermoleophilaceae bacterium]